MAYFKCVTVQSFIGRQHTHWVNFWRVYAELKVLRIVCRLQFNISLSCLLTDTFYFNISDDEILRSNFGGTRIIYQTIDSGHRRLSLRNIINGTLVSTNIARLGPLVTRTVLRTRRRTMTNIQPQHVFNCMYEVYPSNICIINIRRKIYVYVFLFKYVCLEPIVYI